MKGEIEYQTSHSDGIHTIEPWDTMLTLLRREPDLPDVAIVGKVRYQGQQAPCRLGILGMGTTRRAAKGFGDHIVSEIEACFRTAVPLGLVGARECRLTGSKDIPGSASLGL